MKYAGCQRRMGFHRICRTLRVICRQPCAIEHMSEVSRGPVLRFAGRDSISAFRPKVMCKGTANNPPGSKMVACVMGTVSSGFLGKLGHERNFRNDGESLARSLPHVDAMLRRIAFQKKDRIPEILAVPFNGLDGQG
jgi:hypothetical protein